MNKYHGSKVAKNKKLHLSDGYKTVFLTAHQVADLARCSLQNAYKWITDPAKIPPGSLELLQMKALGSIPGFGPGWYFDGEGITGPRGQTFNAVDLENFSLALQVAAHSEADQRKLRERIEWLQKRLSAPDKLRKYSHPKVIPFPGKPAKEA